MKQDDASAKRLSLLAVYFANILASHAPAILESDLKTLPEISQLKNDAAGPPLSDSASPTSITIPQLMLLRNSQTPILHSLATARTDLEAGHTSSELQACINQLQASRFAVALVQCVDAAGQALHFMTVFISCTFASGIPDTFCVADATPRKADVVKQIHDLNVQYLLKALRIYRAMQLFPVYLSHLSFVRSLSAHLLSMQTPHLSGWLVVIKSVYADISDDCKHKSLLLQARAELQLLENGVPALPSNANDAIAVAALLSDQLQLSLLRAVIWPELRTRFAAEIAKLKHIACLKTIGQQILRILIAVPIAKCTPISFAEIIKSCSALLDTARTTVTDAALQR